MTDKEKAIALKEILSDDVIDELIVVYLKEIINSYVNEYDKKYLEATHDFFCNYNELINK